jgi:hypothetical protein
MSLRTAALEIAKDLPRGDPTRRKILAALKVARGGTLLEDYLVKGYMAYNRDTGRMIAKVLGGREDTSELGTGVDGGGFMNVLGIGVVNQDGITGELQLRELSIEEDEGYADGDSVIWWTDETGRERSTYIGVEPSGGSLTYKTPDYAAKGYLQGLYRELKKSGWSLVK